MVRKLIQLALRNRVIVLFIAGGLFAYGIYSIKKNPIDAIPDLSENQVIVFTEWMGRSPQVVEDQVTYPLVSNLQGIPKIKNIRASSMFGMSFVYVIFEDNVDIYWARTRVLERLNYIYPMVNAAHQSLGDLWIVENNAVGAVREYGAIVAHAPVDPAKAHYDLARAYHLNKQDEQAKDELLAALETAPGYRQAQKLLLELNESGTQHDTVKK